MALYLDDRELVIAHKSGDADAFTALVREYRPQLLSAARRRLHCHEAAEDAVQETLVRALRSLPRFNGQYLLGPWLHRILRNVCHDEGKRRGREGDKAERVAVSPDFDVLSNTGPEADLGLDLDHSALHDAFAELPANYQEALRLRFIEELPYPEVAEKSGVSEENARARVSRARAMLRKSLQGVAMLPVVGVVLPMLGKALAGTALLAAVLTPAGDSRQTVNPTPAQPELVRTAEVDVATPLPADLAVTVDGPDGAVGGPDGAVGGTDVAVGGTDATTAGPAGTTAGAGAAAAGAAGTSTATEVVTAGAPSAGGTTAAAAAAAGTGDATGDTGHTGHTGVVLDGAVAGTAALAPGAPFGLAGYNLTVVQAGPSGLGLSGAATLRSADGFADVRINPASRLVVDPAPRPVDAALAALDPDAHHHTAAGRLVVDLPDGTVLAVTLAGTVVHHGSPLLLVQGADLDIAATFDAGVSIPDGVAVSPRHTLPLNGAGAFTGSLVIDTRTGAARLSLQRAA